MSTHAATSSTAVAGEAPRTNYLNDGHTLKSWLLTVDHKRIALLYLGAITVFFAVGGLLALLVRAELFTPEGDMFDSDTYNKVFTLHGIVMIFFFLIPSIPATLGNFLVPIMIGAKDVAFPKINLLSWYVYMTGGTMAVLVILLGGVDTGWTLYPPFSSTYSNTNVALTAMAAFVTGFSSILTGLNFMVTVHKMRAPGMTWFRLPLFIWAHYATSLVMLLGTPVIAITVFTMALERVFHVGIFDPTAGGDPVLFQHMFWFYSHPAVYIMILPGMGVISEVISCFSRKRVFGYPFVAMSSLGIAIIGFLVWGHHMYTTGQSTYANIVFSILTYVVAVPSAIKTFNWTATMYKGSVSMDTPMVYAMCFMGLFLIGGLTGLFCANLGLDVHIHDTYFIVAHFHYVMVGSAMFAYLAGLHFWFPKMFGRMYPEGPAKFGAIVIFIGFNMTFFPQFILGYLGMPRRYHFYPEEWQVLNVLSSAGAMTLGSGILLSMLNLGWALVAGPKAAQNPWMAKGLEWEKASSPPVTANFETPPVVTEEAYNYPSQLPSPAHH